MTKFVLIIKIQIYSILTKRHLRHALNIIITKYALEKKSKKILESYYIINTLSYISMNSLEIQRKMTM